MSAPDLDRQPDAAQLRELALSASVRPDGFACLHRILVDNRTQVLANAAGWHYTWTAGAVFLVPASPARFRKPARDNEARLVLGWKRGRSAAWAWAVLARWPTTQQETKK